MSWEFSPVFDAGHRAALEKGKPLLYIAPPAAWTLPPLWTHFPTPATQNAFDLVLVPDVSVGLDVADVVRTIDERLTVHVCSGVARTARRLAAHCVATLVVTAPDALQLLGRSQLALERLGRVIVLWPEITLQHEPSDALDAALGECREAPRVIVVGDDRDSSDSGLGGFLKRHAHKIPTVVAARPPEEPAGTLRYAAIGRDRLAWATRAALDLLNPGSAYVWDPSPLSGSRWGEFGNDPTIRIDPTAPAERVDLALVAELPTGTVLATLQAVTGQIVVLVRPYQLPYLERLGAKLGAIRLVNEVDRARDRAFDIRRALRGVISDAASSAELIALAPLFDEYDPALVAAAALRMSEPPEPKEEPVREPRMWARIRLDVGSGNRIRTADVVGALLNAVGLARQEVGRVDVRDRFTLVDIRPEAVDRAVQGLNGLLLRGQRVGARMER